MNALSKKLASLGMQKISGFEKKPRADSTTTEFEFFDKAKAIFPLSQHAEEATEHAWKAYIANRVAAQRKYHGPKESEINDEEEKNEADSEPSDIYALNLITNRITELEKELELDEGVISKGFCLLKCDAVFEEDTPRTVTTLTRIYSPTRPVYIDVHFQYHFRNRSYTTEWDYRLGFKIYDHPKTNDFRPSEIKNFENNPVSRAYDRKGWQPIAYGSYDEYQKYGEKWVIVENAKFQLGNDDVDDIYEALWGAQDDTDADGGDEEEEEMHRRSKLVNSVRILLAAAGIKYQIAIDDDERDVSCSEFVLEGLDDKWFARGVRKACGFQLTDDPSNEQLAIGEREDFQNYSDYDDEEDDDD